GDTGYAFVVDANNQVIGHPTLEYTAESQLLDYSSDPAVVALKNSPDRITSYKDSSGNRWRVYTHRLENGWGIIVQQRESEVLAPLRDFQRAALIVILIVAVAVLVSMWVVIGQALRPVRVLTQTASAIAGGDLTRRTAIQRRDEVGVLALSFDTMTSQLQDSINTLEERVKTRTHDLDLARQEAERANNIKSQFLASVSHELRTPLNAIINFTQFVLSGMMGPVTDRQNNALNKSLNSAVHLLDLINDVLDISKIEAGSLQLFVETDVDVAAEAKEVIETAGALLKDKPVELTLEVTPALPLIWGDKQRIRQIMLNLVSNACKFTEQGQIKLCVLRRDESVLVTVTDTGPGIPEEERKIIFEVFQQTQVGLQKGGGTGLGLPISKRLAEAHGGTLWFESTVGKGSTFYVKLPVAAEVLKPLMVSPEKMGEGHG
ncbi:MAG: HAMP domain-containing protein, partial [Chloroflexi bacterium]|nr:HAMP domain-containing protein [Chloroflexota bacterium]